MKLLFSLILTIAAYYVLFQTSYSNDLTNPYMKEVDGMVWGTGKNTLKAEVKDLPKGSDSEEQILLLKIYDAENKTVFDEQLSINWDLNGAGFLKAMQVDNDSELEIVFKTNNGESCDSKVIPVWITCNFYLDMNSGKIEQKNFTSFASTEARKLAKIRLSTASPLEFFIVCFTSPFIFFLIYGFLSLMYFLRKKWCCRLQVTTGT